MTRKGVKKGKLRSRETLISYKSYSKQMDKVFQGLVVIGIISFISVALSGVTLLSQNDLSNKISSDLRNEFNPQFENIKSGINDINSALWLESEAHFLEVMEKIDSSIVAVISYPAKESENNFIEAFYIDEQGNKANIGTGFSINDKGYILTAKHIVEGAQNVSIILTDGNIIPVNTISLNESSDLVILKVETNVPPVEIEDKVLEVGTTVGFIGFPLGYAFRTKTIGTISGYGQSDYTGTFSTIYTIHSLVNKGNSGGPVFSMRSGKVAGVISAGFTDKLGIAMVPVITAEILPK